MNLQIFYQVYAEAKRIMEARMAAKARVTLNTISFPSFINILV